MVNVCLLGCGGHMPLPNRRLTSLLVNFPEHTFSVLVDCGETTQIALFDCSFKVNDIKVICFTHLHTDHTAGLPGLLSAMKNSGREQALTIIGPYGTKKFVDAAIAIARFIPFEIIVNEVGESNSSFRFFPFKIEMQKMFHSCTCYAYKISAIRKRKCLPEKAQKNNVPMEIWNELLENDKVEYKGKKYTANLIALPRKKGITISYCTDTRPTTRLPEFIKDSDLFICEGMYYKDLIDNAIKYKHMTYDEAATVALQASVQELWLTHFSPTLVQPRDYIREAINIFGNTQVGTDGKYKTLLFED